MYSGWIYWTCPRLFSTPLSFSPRPPSTVRRNQYGLVVFPMSIQTVKREKCGVLYFLTLLQSFCIMPLPVFEERGAGPLWLECTPIHSPDLNFPFNRPYSHGYVRFIFFCTNFCLLYSESSVFSLDQVSWFNTVRSLDTANHAYWICYFLTCKWLFIQCNFSCYIIFKNWNYFYLGIHSFVIFRIMRKLWTY